MQEQLSWAALAQVTHEIPAKLSPGITVVARSVRAEASAPSSLPGASSHGPLHRDVHAWWLVTPEGENRKGRVYYSIMYLPKWHSLGPASLPDHAYF